MFPVIGLALGGLAATAFLRRGMRRRPALLDSLAEPGAPLPYPKQGTTGQTRPLGIIGTAIACIERWDGRYQSLIQTRLDPLIMGRLRTEQMQSLAPSVLRELNCMEKRTNRSLVLGVAGLGLIGLAQLTGWPLIPVAIALGIYNAWPALKESWGIAVDERRFSLLHLMLVYFLWTWLGGYYLVGMIGILFGTLCWKYQLSLIHI